MRDPAINYHSSITSLIASNLYRLTVQVDTFQGSSRHPTPTISPTNHHPPKAMPSCDNTSCDNDAKLYCSGCSDAPAYDHPQKAIYYCSKGCQSAHWPKHQLHCKVRRYRKKLLRVATLLQAMVEAYEEGVLESEMQNIELREGGDPAELYDATLRMGAFQDPYNLPMSLLCSISHQLLRGMYDISLMKSRDADKLTFHSFGHHVFDPSVDHRMFFTIEWKQFPTRSAEPRTSLRATPRSAHDHPQIGRKLGHRLR